MLTRFPKRSSLKRRTHYSCNRRGRKLKILICLILATGLTACTYTEQKWKETLSEFNKGIDRKIAETKGQGQRCESAGGVFYKERCYQPDGAAGMDQERTCRMHGGLYIDGICLTDRHRLDRTF